MLRQRSCLRKQVGNPRLRIASVTDSRPEAVQRLHVSACSWLGCYPEHDQDVFALRWFWLHSSHLQETDQNVIKLYHRRCLAVWHQWRPTISGTPSLDTPKQSLNHHIDAIMRRLECHWTTKAKTSCDDRHVFKLYWFWSNRNDHKHNHQSVSRPNCRSNLTE